MTHMEFTSDPPASVGPEWTLGKLQSRVDEFSSAHYEWSRLAEPLRGLRKAAVLIPLVIRDGELYVWLTKRSDKVGHDKGHVSFPGGHRDPSDADAVDTALRESREEINLQPSDLISILGQLPPRVNLRQMLVTPIVALVSAHFVPSPNEEVEFALCVELRRFLTEREHWCSVLDGRYAGYLHFFRDHDTEGHEAITFGMTASMCVTLACAVYGEPTEFEYSPGEQLEPWAAFRSTVRFLEEYIEIGSASLERLRSKL
jgi:coenzyme A diphosphatase NUDT7